MCLHLKGECCEISPDEKNLQSTTNTPVRKTKKKGAQAEEEGAEEEEEDSQSRREKMEAGCTKVF